jgi:heme/copper-type cytochrome/quinol oxidase subunit 1
MFLTGMPVAGELYFMYATMLIAVPTGVKVFNWVSTMWNMRNHTKCWQNHNVDLRMSKEPKDMLEHDWVTATRCIKKCGTKVTVR